MTAGVRFLRSSPGTVVAAALLLAAGIGSATAVFSVIDAVLFRPLGLDQPDQLAAVYLERRDAKGFPYSWISHADWRAFREHRDEIRDIALWFDTGLGYREALGSRRVQVQVVTPNFFDVLGSRPAAGRGFTDGDEAVAVVAHGFREGLGRTIHLDGHPFTVVGEMPRGFSGATLLRAPDVWIPLSQYRVALAGLDGPERIFTQPEFRLFAAVARLGEGVSRERAEQALRASVSYKDFTVSLLPLDRVRAGIADQAGIERYLALVAALVSMILLMTCVSAGGLLLAQAIDRRRDFAIRVALGASRTHLARQILAQSLVPAAGGAVGGITLAYALLPVLAGLSGMQAGGIHWDARLDIRALLFAVALCMLAAVVTGLAPLLGMIGRDAAQTIQQRAGATEGTRLRSALVVAQVALCLMLVFAAGLFSATLQRLLAIDTGYRHGNLLAITIEGRSAGRVRGDLLDRVRSVPGVEAASLAFTRPLSRVQGGTRVAWQGGAQQSVSANWVIPGYFETVGLDLLRGRTFAAREDAREVIVSASMARLAFGDGDAVGRGIRVSGESLDRTVVAVVRDAVYRRPGEAALPYVYLPMDMSSARPKTLVVRTAGDPARWIEPVRREIAALQPDLTVSGATTHAMQERIATARERIAAGLSSLLALIAVGLAIAGMFGLMSYQTVARSREFGVRLAMGARPADLTWFVVRGAARLSLWGAVAGGIGCYWVSRAASGLLTGVEPWAIEALVAPVTILIAITVLASWIPARRAAGTDPVASLRAG